MKMAGESTNSEEIPLLTFNSLYTILREERKIRTLQNLPERFYESLNEFFKSKKKELLALKDDATQKEKFKKEKMVFSNSQKIARELISLRAMKISNIGIKNEIFEEEILTKENILKEEEIYYKDLSDALTKLRGNTLR